MIALATLVAVVALFPVWATAVETRLTLFTVIVLMLSPGLAVPAEIVKEPVAAVPPTVPPVICILALALPSNQSVILTAL